MLHSQGLFFDPVSRYKHEDTMTPTPKCSNCGRCGGSQAGGATINTMGCTGACLHWAVALVRNCLHCNTEHPWENWTVTPNQAAAFGVIAAGISQLGCGYLHWNLPPACAAIEEVHDRYTFYMLYVHPLDLVAPCPDEVNAYYVTLAALHERCVQLPTKVYALNLEPAQHDAWNMVLTSLNGESVGEILKPAGGLRLDPWKLLPQPFYSIAADGNLYTYQEFRDYYGEETFHSSWKRAFPCYDHDIDIVDEDGSRIEGWQFHGL